ncbi:MAG: hypothetical protein JWR83_3298 [Aeromicrobium sp.]|nr:hypothetical protein [Aeromicrobium sp.]
MKLSPTHKFFSATAAMSVLLLTAACGSSSSDGASTSPTTAATTDSSSSTSSATYKDGSYDAKGAYPNPAGSSTIEVKLTLASGKVTQITVTPEATDPTSKGFETQFAGGISAEVVGKSIDSLNVSTVAGSSLTVQGFDKAIDTIKADAKA